MTLMPHGVSLGTSAKGDDDEEQSSVDLEESGDKIIFTSKPTIEYGGYQRTITEVVRIRRGEKEGDKTGVVELMEGLDDAIKICRGLCKRLESVHRKRDTGFYGQIHKVPPLSK